MNLKMFVNKSCSQRIKMDLACDTFLIQVSLFPTTEEGRD